MVSQLIEQQVEVQFLPHQRAFLDAGGPLEKGRGSGKSFARLYKMLHSALEKSANYVFMSETEGAQEHAIQLLRRTKMKDGSQRLWKYEASGRLLRLPNGSRIFFAFPDEWQKFSGLLCSFLCDLDDTDATLVAKIEGLSRFTVGKANGKPERS
jgi:hypothetical protein